MCQFLLCESMLVRTFMVERTKCPLSVPLYEAIWRGALSRYTTESPMGYDFCFWGHRYDIVYAWKQMFNSALDSHCPWREMRVKRVTQAHWMSKHQMQLHLRDYLLTRSAPTFFVLAAHAVAPSIARLINYSFATGKFPDRWKIAKVTPLFKSCDVCDPYNYRPISVLVVLFKIIERHIQLCLWQRPIILIKIIDDLLFNLENDRVSGMVLVENRKGVRHGRSKSLAQEVDVVWHREPRIEMEGSRWLTLTERSQTRSCSSYFSSTTCHCMLALVWIYMPTIPWSQFLRNLRTCQNRNNLLTAR